jgi:integration host factor subunit beta
MKLKKSALIERLVEEMGFFTDEEIGNKAKTEIARETVNLFFGSIKESLTAGDRVEIRGFGSFHVKEYGSYTGRNPKTGETVEVQPKKLPVFRAGKELRVLVDSRQSK